MPQYTAEFIASHVGGALQGDSSHIISGVADLASAESRHASFLGNPKYLAQARRTKAGVVLLSHQDPQEFSFTQIRVESPSFAFAKVVDLFAPPAPVYQPGVHPSAVVAADVILGEGVSVQPCAVIEAGARIGARTVIGANAYVGARAVLGEDCLLYPQVVVREDSVIGNHVILHCGSVIGGDGFGYDFRAGRHQKIPQIGYVQLDDHVEVGAGTTIDRGRFDRTWIGEGTKIDNLVMIAHNVRVGKHCLIVSQTGISGSTTLGNYVTLAGQVGTVGHITIADGAIVTAQSGVSKDVPAKTTVAGRHAIPLRDSLKVEALTRRLPELLERIKTLEETLRSHGLSGKSAEPADCASRDQ
ncbi:MAG: UDP-3-O-(3-hydroxymyristoyl)glucosamine N-acyltransferase [Candidatus Methylacidiphilales bacterium]|nr:UDP-3-O-(3-hydroxymyristoyl)glucosamine N-acyltransferase [Candidatus Methylacidiphilales bacterium]